MAPFALLALVAFAVVSWHMHEHPYVSPIDEPAHFDYVQGAPSVPALGDRLDQVTLNEIACRTFGPDRPETAGPCGVRPYDPAVVPNAGFSTGGFSPPLYYWSAGGVAHALAAITPWSLWDISRGSGGVWLWGLMSASFAIGVRLGAPRVAAFGASLIVGTSSGIVTAAATIGPDVATATLGGLVVLAALAYNDTARSALIILGAVAAAALTKFTSFTAVGAVMIFFLVFAAVRIRDRDKLGFMRLGLMAVGAFMSFALVSFLWGLRFRSTASVGMSDIPFNQPFLVDRIPWEIVNPTLYTAFIPPVTGDFNMPFLSSPTDMRISEWVAGILVIGVLGAALAFGRAPRASALAWGTLTLAVLGPLLLTLSNFYANGLLFGIPPRYGYALLPACAGLTAWTMRSPNLGRGLLAVGVLSLLSIFW